MANTQLDTEAGMPEGAVIRAENIQIAWCLAHKGKDVDINVDQLPSRDRAKNHLMKLPRLECEELIVHWLPLLLEALEELIIIMHSPSGTAPSELLETETYNRNAFAFVVSDIISEKISPGLLKAKPTDLVVLVENLELRGQLQSNCLHDVSPEFASLKVGRKETPAQLFDRAVRLCIKAERGHLLEDPLFVQSVYIPQTIKALDMDRFWSEDIPKLAVDRKVDIKSLNEYLTFMVQPTFSLYKALSLKGLPASKLTIFFIRHGETDYNAERRMQGGIDIPLNSRGIEQAREVSEQFKAASVDFEAVFSSDLQRAKKTAEMLANDAEVRVIPGLRERSMGILEGMLYHDALVLAAKDGKAGVMSYGESEKALISRLDSAWKDITTYARENNLSRVAVVSHGGALAMLFRHLAASKLVSRQQVPDSFGSRLTNCCVTVVQDGDFKCYGAQLTEARIHVDKDLL